MANQDRARVEVLRRRVYPTTGTGTINIGDVVCDDGSGNAISAAEKTDGSTAAGAKDKVADAILGVALHYKKSTETPQILVGVDLIAELDVAAASGLGTGLAVGTVVEIAEVNIAGTHTPSAQAVDIASTNPIGKLARKGAVGDKTVYVHIVGKDVAGVPAAD